MTLPGRFARVSEAEVVFNLLCTGREAIPLTDNVAGPAYVEWIRGLCRQRKVRVIEEDEELAAMMVLIGSEIKYLVTSPKFFRRGFASSLLSYAKRRWSELRAEVNGGNAELLPV
jgi:hypothetical protein